jgi:hypothetical protein
MPRTILMGMLREEWEKLKRRARSRIRLFPADSVLRNVSGEDSTKKPWENLGSLYQLKYMVNKVFLRNKLYLLRMSDGISITQHPNAFNTVIIQLFFVDIKITKEEKCIIMLFSLLESSDSLIVAIGGNSTTLVIENIVAYLFLE